MTTLLSLARKIPFIKRELSRVSAQSYRAGRRAESEYTNLITNNLITTAKELKKLKRELKKTKLEKDRFEFIAKKKAKKAK